MPGRSWCVLVILVVVTGSFLPCAAAQNKQEKTKKKQEAQHDMSADSRKGISHADDNKKHDGKPEAEHEMKRHNEAEQGWDRRDGFEVRVFGDQGTRPLGWSRGKKTGWGNCGVPPGHAKNGECRTYRYQGRRYYYYVDDGGRMIVRRPIINVTIR